MPGLYAIQQEIKDYFLNGGLDIKDLDAELKSKEKVLLSKETYEQLSVYKSLIIDSIAETLQKIYPLVYKVLKYEFAKRQGALGKEEVDKAWDDEWTSMTRTYIQQYPGSSPVFNEAVKDFPEFLKANSYKPEYIFELAFYEWAMLALFLHEDLPLDVPVTPVHLLCDFSFPIVDIAEEIEKDNLNFGVKTELQKVLIYRDENSKKMRTMVLSPLTAFVILKLNEGTPRNEIEAAIKKEFKLSEAQLASLGTNLEALSLDLQEKAILLNT